MHPPFPLGRKVEHDPASRMFGFAPRAALPVVEKTWRRYGAVLDQGDVGSCTGNAFTHAMNSKPNHVIGTKTLGQSFALMIYSAATRADEFPGAYLPTDTGSSALGVGKAALGLGLISEYRWGFGLEHTLQILMERPVMIGTWWYESMFWPDAQGFVRPSGSPAGGHEYLLVGVKPREQVLIFQNSWSSLWGDNGRFRMRFADFAPLLADQGDAMIPVRK
jgi:hypothetical protein